MSATLSANQTKLFVSTGSALHDIVSGTSAGGSPVTIEEVHDAVADDILVSGFLTKSKNDGSNTVTLGVSAGSFTDTVQNSLSAGTNVTISKVGGKVQISAAGGGVGGVTLEQVHDAVADDIVASGFLTKTKNDTGNTVTLGVSAALLVDAIQNSLSAGTNVTISKSGGKVQINSTASGGGGGVSIEQVHDAVADDIRVSGFLTKTKNDSSNTVTLDISAHEFANSISTVLAAGNNVTITRSDNIITISSTGSAGGGSSQIGFTGSGYTTISRSTSAVTVSGSTISGIARVVITGSGQGVMNFPNNFRGLISLHVNSPPDLNIKVSGGSQQYGLTGSATHLMLFDENIMRRVAGG